MVIYLQLFASALVSVALSVLFYLLQQKTAFGKWNYWVRQVLIGLFFGGAAVLGTEYGVDVGGATANARDAAPLCAGLLFGAPAGILAGVIGGVERWFAVAWGAGAYSRVACSVSTVLAGFYAAALRKFMFDDKRPTAGFGAATAVVIEVVHLSILFLTHLTDSENAYRIVKICTLPMIFCNAVSVTLAIFALSFLSRGFRFEHRRERTISQKVQTWMLLCIVVAYFVTTAFVYVLQTNTANVETDSLLTLNITDVKNELKTHSDEQMLSVTRQITAEIEGGRTDLPALAQIYHVSEINIVDETGIITASTDGNYPGFDMASGEQAKEFLVLLEGQREYVQPFQPATYDHDDPTRDRKYAGCALSSGGFVQVGYNAFMFQNLFAEELQSITRNRHVGSDGYLVIINSHGQVLNYYSGELTTRSYAEIIQKLDSVRPLTHQTATVGGERVFWMYARDEGYAIVAIRPVSTAMATRDAATYVNSYMEVLVFAALFALIYFLIKRLVVNNIRSVNRNLKKIIGGDLSITVDVRSSSEFSSLSDDINSTVTTLKHYIAEAAARIDKELEFAKSIQTSALPKTFPAFPEHPQLDLYATMQTAKEVGGDFYDFYALDDRHVAFLIADVSGKGIPAAMFMMRAKTMIKDFAMRGLPANEIFTDANQMLCEGNDAGMFVTAWIGILDVCTGHVTFANAGHNPPLLYRKGEGFSYFRSRAGMVLAGMEGLNYKLQEFDLAPGDRIYLYTDGVTEATDAENRLYGEPRLLEFLNAHSDLSAKDTLLAVKQDLDEFYGDAEQFDDITMLMLDYFGGSADKMTEKTFPATIEAHPDAAAFLEEQLEAAGCGMKAMMQISVAFEELFVNVAHYAYPEGAGTVTVSVCAEDGMAIVSLTDSGVPFDPLARPDPDVTLSAADRSIGGLGIFMVKKTMDRFTYERRGSQNVVTIAKLL